MTLLDMAANFTVAQIQAAINSWGQTVAGFNQVQYNHVNVAGQAVP
jgi:hypothetical protein